MSTMCRILYYPSVASTQDVAKQWVIDNVRTYDAVYTDHQITGRGRQDSHWYDQPYSSLLVSYVLWDEPLPQPAGILSMLTAVAATRSMEFVFPDLPMVQVKYPNDLMLKGRKAGGILTEVLNNTAIVGIGINLAQTSFPESLEDTAISIGQVLERNFAFPESRDYLLHQIWNHMREELAQYRQEPTRLWQVCVERDCTAKRIYQILDLPDQPQGIALAIEPDMRLCLRLPDGSTHSTYFVRSLP